MTELSATSPADPSRAQSERRRMFIRAELAQIILNERLRSVALVADLDRMVEERVQKARRCTLAVPNALAPKLAGRPPAVVEKALRQAINGLLAEMAA